jgi:hypothetical protein
MPFQLFPHKYKKISALLFAISFAGLAALFIIDNLAEDLGNDIISFFNAHNSTIIKPNVFYNLFLDEAFMLIVVCAGLVHAFCKEKEENETIATLRYKSLIWSFIINYGLLLVLYLTVYGIAAYTVVTAFILSQLLIFILHFRISLYRFYKKK